MCNIIRVVILDLASVRQNMSNRIIMAIVNIVDIKVYLCGDENNLIFVLINISILMLDEN